MGMVSGGLVLLCTANSMAAKAIDGDVSFTTQFAHGGRAIRYKRIQKIRP
jgi:hypothetical protein